MSDTNRWWSQSLSFRFLPVLDLDDASTAVEATRVLTTAGVPTIEFSLKRHGALDSMAAAIESSSALVGAGTVFDPGIASEAIDRGARFIVSPCLVEAVASLCAERSVPYLPGVATATEVLAAVQAGVEVVKWFPAEMLGGVAGLGQIAGVFPKVRFVPIGGIREEHVPGYLAHPAVLAVGGTLLASRQQCVAAGWKEIVLAVDRFARMAAAAR